MHSPDGYPLPRTTATSSTSATIGPSGSAQCSIYLSRVTLAMMDAAPTILKIESALGHTVNLIPGKAADNLSCQI